MIKRILRAITLRRYWPTLGAFVSTAAILAFLDALMAHAESLIFGPVEADVPPLIMLVFVASISFGALVAGVFLVPLRRLVIGPRPPFVRWGYVAYATLPVFYMLVAEGSLGSKILWTFLLQVPLAVVALLFVGLGRLFGAFDPEEIGAPGHPVPDRS